MQLHVVPTIYRAHGEAGIAGSSSGSTPNSLSYVTSTIPNTSSAACPVSDIGTLVSLEELKPQQQMGQQKHLIRHEGPEMAISTISPNPHEDPSGQIKALIRIRPLTENEKVRGDQNKIVYATEDENAVQAYTPSGQISVMPFDRVFDEDTGQTRFFEESGIQQLIIQAINGYAATIFAFGQTGSGKTFTITGPNGPQSPQALGIVPRALSFMFDCITAMRQANQLESIRIQASYLEIYNENVHDLLNTQNSTLPVRWSSERGFYVENLLIVDCDVLEDSLAVLEEGLRNRTVASHNMNEHSSRSHSVLTIYLEARVVDANEGRPVKCHGKISFVDLAGSEKVKESKASGDTFTEALSINKSLLTLGLCISALSDPRKRLGHIPFRDSKLTKLLSDSLGGHGVALMIACVSPGSLNIQETNKTLRYASKARRIHTKPTLHLDPREEMVLILKREIVGLRRENLMLRGVLDSNSKSGSPILKSKDSVSLNALDRQAENMRSMRETNHEYGRYDDGQSAYGRSTPRLCDRTTLSSTNHVSGLHDTHHRSRTPILIDLREPFSTNGKDFKATNRNISGHSALYEFGGSTHATRQNAMAGRSLVRSQQASRDARADGYVRSGSTHESGHPTMATYRVNALKRSDAPAGHEYMTPKNGNVAGTPISGRALAMIPQKPVKSPAENTKVKLPKIPPRKPMKPKPPPVSTSPIKLAHISKKETTGIRRHSQEEPLKKNGSSVQSPARLISSKRPSNREKSPTVAHNEEFPLINLEHNSNGSLHEQEPSVDRVLEAVNNRGKIMNDVKALENEIGRMTTLN
ncbi:hypothetical protein BASA50_004203 [Batrachochytrium salamandrivorans]|uniref:Kinesin-like protein n=1 Tax=Batrachochytrium salamandrivorans TaxID=1357716 RepID=A0ABQ8FJ95_9FUNG|nr:hypothetical protein BASA50_004203 [Batrachochytrium salamandrivorans]